MPNPFSVRVVVLVGLLAIVLPLVSRVVSSPFTLLLISPIILCIFAFSYFSLSIYLGWYLDTQRTQAPNHLHRAARPLAFSTPAAWQAVLTRSQWSQNTPKSLPPLYPESNEVSDALNDIISMIIRDFVNNWYSELSSSPAFPIAVTSVVHASLQQLTGRASNIDIYSLVVKRILPKVTAHIDHFRESELALRGAGLERKLTQSDELDLLLASRYAGKGAKLHPAVENLSTTFTRQTEEAHIRQLVDKALPFILPPKERNSKALKLVVREIVACAVLYPVVEMASDPDFWNRMIDQVAGAAIHQQQLISKVRNVLEAQLPRHNKEEETVGPTPVSGAMERITTRTSARQFESFLRSINRCSSLLDARRLKNDIVGEIRRTRLLLASHQKEDWIDGEKTEDVVAFLDRLYTAKRKVEDRIVVLGGEDESHQQPIPEAGLKAGISLRDILRNPNSLSYFMEFMDRRQRSLLVQFWLTVESFKNPLEAVDSDSSGEDEEIIQDPSTLTDAKEDITMINDLYFAGGKTHSALSAIPKKHVDAIRAFVLDPNPSATSQRKVRRSVLLSQRQIERSMEQDFDDFERSELWFRAIGDADFSASKITVDPYQSQRDKEAPLNISPGRPERQPLSQAPLMKQSLAISPQVPPSSEIAGLFGMQRSISSTSNQSNLSKISSGYVPSNIEVLMSPVDENSTSSHSRAPLFDDPEDEMQRQEEKRMEAIQAALTDIMALEEEEQRAAVRPSLHERRASEPLFNSASRRHDRPKKRQAVFDDAMDDVDDVEEPEREGSPDDQGSFALAAPGDLQLSYEIDRLGKKIAHLEAQDAMLDSLIKKAELTGDTQELRLLRKSKSSMTRELRQLNFQRQQYEQQESANRLVSERTKVNIINSTAADEGGKQVVRYLVEVQQLALDGNYTTGWVVARRYNEFHNMHNKLKERYALVRNLDFPGKRLVTSLSGSFLDSRKVALEKYLQSVIAIPIVCESDDLRLFLSRDSPFIAAAHQEAAASSKISTPFSGTDLVRNMYRSVAESIDDMFFGPSMLDVMIQRLTRQAAEFNGIVGSGVNDEDLVAQALNASGNAAPEATLMKLSGDLKPLDGETSSSSFISPICDLILAVFELHKKNNWLRRQAIVIILQQVLGGTIERKLRESAKMLLGPLKLLSYLGAFRDTLWPGGRLKPPSTPRSADEKLKTRDDANRKLSSLVPDLAANMIGRSNARRGARRIFAVLQNRRLNQHIMYTIIDEVFFALFPETALTQSTTKDRLP
ncbi:PhoX domain-containing protein [Crepidotus variabilis]|uniref:PhoX domain-containing protein n=1 Tax=Crepidotus variabilis TaxID=179855 RepID=A0A9P6EMP3_9AGAR|nr:PhoX domain-containing protein [Crepidotus variabilis]